MERICSHEEQRERETFLRNKEREENKREDEERMRERAHLAKKKRDARVACVVQRLQPLTSAHMYARVSMGSNTSL